MTGVACPAWQTYSDSALAVTCCLSHEQEGVLCLRHHSTTVQLAHTSWSARHNAALLKRVRRWKLPIASACAACSATIADAYSAGAAHVSSNRSCHNNVLRRLRVLFQVAAPEQQGQEQQRRPPAIAAPSSAARVTSLQQLPQDIRNATALLEAPNASAPGGSTRVWVLGASHVSQVSCRQIKDLIRAVRPEVRQQRPERVRVVPGWTVEHSEQGCKFYQVGKSRTLSV